MSASLFLAGRIIWRSEQKATRTGKPMRSILIASDEENMPPVRALVFGEDAEHAAVGDFISVEGPPEVSTYEKNGEVKLAVSLMARWSRLSGHAGARQRRSEAAKRRAEKRKSGDRQDAIDAFAPCGPPSPEPPSITAGAPFDDPIDDLC